jgi:small-conductance mechanosensitive channel
MYHDELNLIKSLSITLSIFGISFVGFYFFWKLIDRQLTLWSQKTSSDLDDKIVAALRSPSKLLLLSLSLGFSLTISPIMASIQNPLMTGAKLMIISSMIWAIERVVCALIYSQSLPATMSESSRALLRTISRTLVYSIGLLIVLDTLGISITPLLASLGVGSVAIALAAQDTLSNLFSGFYILLDRPFRIGDCIKIDSGIEGFVTKIGWRSTHIRLFANNVAVIPNSKIASSMITNFDFPESDTAITIPVSTAYESDLKKVEQVVLEVAFLIQNTLPFASKQQPPAMAYTEFGNFAVHFNVVLRAQRITDASAIKHEFIKALHARFQQEGISIPYPQHVIRMGEGSRFPNP